MSALKIYRGAGQIGGCCTEITSGGERVLIDFGANLPDTDALISDDKLVSQVFDGRPVNGLLFTHPHGDHYGLYKKAPAGTPMYIGPLAKDILRILVSRLDYISEEPGLPVVEKMETYRDGEELGRFQSISVTPLGVDHSAPDAYMFYIETAGKKILFTGDFRDHGILGDGDKLWDTLARHVPKGIDLLVTEGTMLSRTGTDAPGAVRTEEQLGMEAEKLFRQRKYNFVLVSSTNLDSIMEFYHHAPEESCFVCDDYQAEIMLTAMGARKDYPRYHPSASHPVIHVLWKPRAGSTRERQAAYTETRCAALRELAGKLGVSLDFQVADPSLMYSNGFVMLVRKNSTPGRLNVFERMRDKFYSVDGQIIYSMWDGYLEGRHADKSLIRYIGNCRCKHLHTSGHAYVDTIAQLMETVDPRVIVPMHTECAQNFKKLPEFARWWGRVRELKDGMPLPLDTL